MLEKSLWLFGAHLAAVAGTIVLNTTVLCAGSAKYDNGCGGFQTYFILWSLFTIPLLIVAIVLEWRNQADGRSGIRVVIYAVAVIAVIELGWFVLRKFPLVLLLEALVIVGAILAQRYSSRRTAPRR